MSKREQGDALEKYLLDQLKRLGIAGNMTAGSGAVKGDGDIHTRTCAFECKSQHELRGKMVTSPTIKINEFEKIEHQALTVGKQPVLVLENSKRNRFAVMELDQFLQLLAKVEQYNG